MSREDQPLGQLTFYWEFQFRPRLEGLTDEEYRWLPAPNRPWDLVDDPDGTSRYTDPAADDVVVPTIAWRLMHIAVGCFHIRTSTFFGDGSIPADATMFDPRHLPATVPGTAAEALAFLGHSHQQWSDGIAGLTPEELAAPLGPRGAHFAESPMSDLVLHINREVMHHGGEICLLRDLYAAA